MKFTEQSPRHDPSKRHWRRAQPKQVWAHGGRKRRSPGRPPGRRTCDREPTDLDHLAAAFEKVDAILTPTAPTAAFAHGEKSGDLIAMYLNDVLTVPASLAGLPAISVPAGLSSDGLPLGLHLITNAFDEEMLFRAAEALEMAANFTASEFSLARASS